MVRRGGPRDQEVMVAEFRRTTACPFCVGRVWVCEAIRRRRKGGVGESCRDGGSSEVPHVAFLARRQQRETQCDIDRSGARIVVEICTRVYSGSVSRLLSCVHHRTRSETRAKLTGRLQHPLDIVRDLRINRHGVQIIFDRLGSRSGQERFLQSRRRGREIVLPVTALSKISLCSGARHADFGRSSGASDGTGP